MSFYVKDGGTWKEITDPRIKINTDWTTVSEGYVRTGGIWYKFFGETPGNVIEYNTAGTYSYTVPGGVQQLQIAATGGGGSGSVVFYNAGSYGYVNGANGGNTSVALPSGDDTWSVTANGGYGGRLGSNRGTVSVSGQLSATFNQTGGNNSGGTGGASFYGSGSGQVGDFSRSSTPTYGAGSGGGFPDGASTQGGDAGGTFIGVFPVRSGEVVSITVGAGGAARTSSYTRGPDHGSYSGTGGSGRVVITVPQTIIFDFSSETVLFSSGLAPDSSNFENSIVPAFQTTYAEAFYSQGYTAGPGQDSNYRVFVKEGYRVVSSDGTFTGSTSPGTQVNFYEGRTVTGINTSHNGGTSFSIRRDDQVRV